MWLDRHDMNDDATKRRKHRTWRNNSWKLLLWSLFLVYPGVSRKILGMLECRQVDGMSPHLPSLDCLLSLFSYRVVDLKQVCHTWSAILLSIAQMTVGMHSYLSLVYLVFSMLLAFLLSSL
jgi:hypothetical protein